MDTQQFRYYLNDYIKEIKEELPKIKAINDLEKQYNATSSAYSKYFEKLNNLIRWKPDSVSRYDPDWEKYEKLVRELWDLKCELVKKVNQEREKTRDEKWRQDYQLKTSHCSYCKSKPPTDHYIYSQKSKILKPRKRNAKYSKEWLFCSEEHFEKWHKNNYFTCAECLKENYTGNWKYNTSRKDGQKFCSDNCFYHHYAETCDNCSEKCVSSRQGQATGYAQTYYQDGINKTGTLCSKCHREKLKEEREASRENCKTCSKKLPYNYLYSLCSACLNKLEEEQKKANQEEEDNEQEIRYCKYCSAKLDPSSPFKFCNSDTCIDKWNEEVSNKRERERANVPTVSNL